MVKKKKKKKKKLFQTNAITVDRIEMSRPSIVNHFNLRTAVIEFTLILP